MKTQNQVAELKTIRVSKTALYMDNYGIGEHTVSFDSPGQPEEIKGCPLGRGSTEERAIADLIERVYIENHYELVIED